MGITVMADGEIYNGIKQNNLKHGKGKTENKFEIYTGEHKNNKKHG
jgi:hypothetical protein